MYFNKQEVCLNGNFLSTDVHSLCHPHILKWKKKHELQWKAKRSHNWIKIEVKSILAPNT